MNSNEATIPELQLAVEAAMQTLTDVHPRLKREATRELRRAIQAYVAAEYQHGFRDALHTEPVTCVADLIEGDDGHV